MLNNFTATARVVAEAEVKESGNTIIGTMRVVNSTNKKKGGEWVESPFFFRVISFGAAAERLKQFSKGDMVVVTGELVCEKYGTEGKQAFNLNINKIERLFAAKNENTKDDDIDLDDDIEL